jgi:DNA-binding ferritin-like protein (Dps family)
MPSCILILFLIFADNLEAGIVSILSAILLLSLVATFIAYISLKKTRTKLSSLPKSYQDVYIDANELTGLSTTTLRNKKEISDLILEIFEHAYLEGRKVEDVISPNLRTFMDGFIDSVGAKTTWLYLVSYSTFVYTIYLLFMKLYVVLRHGQLDMATIQTETLDFGILVLYGIIAYVFLPWILLSMQHAAKHRLTGIKQLQVALPFLISVGLVITLILIKDSKTIAILDKPIPLLTTPLSIILLFVVCLGSLVLMGYVKKYQLRKALK